MNELQIFKNYLFGEVRTVLIENEVWFVLIDVCRALNLTNSRMVASRLDDDEVSKFDLRGQSGETHIVNESVNIIDFRRKITVDLKTLKELIFYLKNNWRA